MEKDYAVKWRFKALPYERKSNILKAPKSKQYTANGVSVLVLKYLVRNFTEK